jgi:hypothetical protein
MKTFCQYSFSSFLDKNPIEIETYNYNLCKIGIQKPYSFDHFSVTEETKNTNDTEEDRTIPPSITIKYTAEYAEVAEDGSITNKDKIVTQDFHITRRWCLEHSNIYVKPNSTIFISVNKDLMPKEFLLDLELSEI